MKFKFLHYRDSFKASSELGFAVSLLISLFFVLKTFHVSFVLGSSSYWQTQVDDVTQYISGFNMFMSAPWKLPLLYFDNVNFPEGTLVTFVDGIPLYSLILKFILPTNIGTFNPFGGWVAICFLMQGVSAWCITRALRIDSWWFLLFLIVVFLTFPALMARLGHISLMSHWIILFSFALYISTCKNCKLAYVRWSVLLVSAFYINIYIFTMASGIYVAAFLLLRPTFTRRNIYHFSFPFVILLFTTAIMIFPLPPGSITKEGGFGVYSMNFLSPIKGGRIFSLQAGEGPGQYEGFNYLGLGLIISSILSFIIIRSHNYKHFRKHVYLVVLMALYTFYALSDQIYFGSQKILVLSYPGILEGLTSQFRASGRFFWPVGYGIAIASILIIYREYKKYYFIMLCLILISLQVLDLRDRYRVLVDTSRRAFVEKLDYTLWDRVIHNEVDSLYYYPKFKCGQNPHETLLPVMRYAAEHNLNVNTGYVARYTPSCTSAERDIKEADKKTSAFIFSKLDYPELDKVKELFVDIKNIHCDDVQFSYICQINEMRNEK
ncbi:DUF6311 domain-containing protein [Vibrio fluvialis]|uniref:DUF6311 domain-containing protein n=1 Tax=Vibrio fluvialis TaxID=676 RepID=UPI00192AAD86|nr:hypothetical protein [Vibrio fluvialis]MBY7847281.1 hypothetical protein [Vibrio fluvialis]MBY8082959.1 hypothetical protein [Vibrio fluvialis]